MRYIETVLASLGSEYSLKTIDREECIHRKINDTYDIEISGCHRKGHKIYVYVWDVSQKSGKQIVEHIPPVTSVNDLIETLNYATKKYQDL